MGSSESKVVPPSPLAGLQLVYGQAPPAAVHEDNSATANATTSLLGDNPYGDKQFSQLCSRCQNLQVHGSVTDLESRKLRITQAELQNGIKDGCQLCTLMKKHSPDFSSGNWSIDSYCNSDPANHLLCYVEFFQSPYGIFLLSIEPDDPAANLLSRRRLVMKYDSETAYNLIRRWISECGLADDHDGTLLHSNCGAMTAKPFPTRLIDVGSANQDPFLVTPGDGVSGFYVALSYCWGLQQPTTLTMEKLSAGMPVFPIQQLPATLRDAMLICRELKFQYIWIDALCIIQDSPNGEDWMIESGKMNEIYGNAALTIGASAAKDTSEGILDNFYAASRSDSCIIPYHLEDGRVGKAFVNFYPHQTPRNQPLTTRAWTLQEHLLSPRFLSLQKTQLVWECREKKISSNMPSTSIKPSKEEKWYDVVSQFTSRQMTFSSDRLAALSGYAKSKFLISESSNSGGVNNGLTYLAGLRSDNILTDLLWTSAAYPNYRRPTAYRAPSWSWASVDSEIHPVESEPALFTGLEVVDFTVTASSLNPFGSVPPLPPSYIRLRGYTKCAAGAFLRRSRNASNPPISFTIDFSTKHSDSMEDRYCMFGVRMDTLDDAEMVMKCWRFAPNAESGYFDSSCPFWILKMTDKEALVLMPTLKQGLESWKFVFRRVGIATALWRKDGNYGTWFDEVTEKTIVTLV